MMMFKLSIIVPIYKSQDYIKECMISILEQLPPEVQILCINDGTPDNSMQIVEAMLDNYSENIRKQFILINQDNQGLSGARNTGLENANGEYIGFVDSDDKILPNFFNEILKKISDSNYDIVDFDLIDSNGRQRSTRQGQLDTIDSVFKSSNWYCCCRVFKKTLFTKYKFTKEIYYEDLALTPKLYLNSNETIHIAKPLYWYRLNENGITLNSTDRANQHTIKSFEIILNSYIKLYNEDPNIYYYYLIVTTYFLLCVNACRRFSLKKSFYYIEKYKSIIKGLNQHEDSELEKLFTSKLLAFYKQPKLYVSAYNLYRKFKIHDIKNKSLKTV